MWYSIKLVVLKVEFRANVNIGTFVFGTIAVLGGGENLKLISDRGGICCGKEL